MADQPYKCTSIEDKKLNTPGTFWNEKDKHISVEEKNSDELKTFFAEDDKSMSAEKEDFDPSGFLGEKTEKRMSIETENFNPSYSFGEENEKFTLEKDNSDLSSSFSEENERLTTSENGNSHLAHSSQEENEKSMLTEKGNFKPSCSFIQENEKCMPTEKENFDPSSSFREENEKLTSTESENSNSCSLDEENEKDYENLKEIHHNKAKTTIPLEKKECLKANNKPVPKPRRRQQTYKKETLEKKETFHTPPTCPYPQVKITDAQEENPSLVSSQQMLHASANQTVCREPFKQLPVCGTETGNDTITMIKDKTCGDIPASEVKSQSKGHSPIRQRCNSNETLPLKSKVMEETCPLLSTPNIPVRKASSFNDHDRPRPCSSSEHLQSQRDSTKKMMRKMRMKIFEPNRGLIHIMPIPNTKYISKKPPTRDTLPDDEMWALASELRCEWVSLADYLGYTKSQIDEIEGIDPNPQIKHFLVLANWQRTYNDEYVSVRKKLSFGLQHCNRVDLMEKVGKKTYYPDQ